MSIGERATAALRPANQNPFHPSQWGSPILWPFLGSSNGCFGEREGGHLLRIFYCAHQPLPRIVHIIWSYFGCSANEESTPLFLWTKNNPLQVKSVKNSQVVFPAVSVTIQLVTVMVILEVILECQCSDGSWRLQQLHSSLPAAQPAAAPEFGYSPTYSSFVWPSASAQYRRQT